MLKAFLHIIYLRFQDLHSAWIGRRCAKTFDSISTFCLFIGYPRSGHTLVGSLLNAHPNAVIAHEINAPEFILSGSTRNQLYARILARAYWFNMRGNSSNYTYHVHNQWQGKFQSLDVIGDKRGGAVSRCIIEHPHFLDQVRDLVGIPVRFIHVVRNPFDNISAISICDKRPLADSIDYYFLHCQTTGKLTSLCQDEELFTVHHEEMIKRPKEVLTDLCQFMSLVPQPKYLEDCCRIIFPSPTYTRRKVSWSASQINNVQTRLSAYPFLSHYRFDDDI